MFKDATDAPHRMFWSLFFLTVNRAFFSGTKYNLLIKEQLKVMRIEAMRLFVFERTTLSSAALYL